MAPFLTMTGITKRFPGVTANEGIDLRVDRGEIHGLLGENGAGKTTLVNILYGLLQPDEGSIEVDGRPVRLRSPRASMALGIGMVHQHFMLVPDMTVAENVALGLRSSRPPLARLGEVSAHLAELSDRYGLRVAPDQRIEDLTVAMQQRVEILKLLYRGAQLLILDEPTAVLTPAEWEELAAMLRSLVAEGRSAIFITHKLEELLAVVNRCTVLRDGRVVGTIEDPTTTDTATLARMMVGRDVVLRVDRPVVEPGATVLTVRELSVAGTRGPGVRDLSFEIRAGEILGVAGVDGNGQDELVDVLTGMRRPTAGDVTVSGYPTTLVTPRAFAERAGAVIPADRHRTALALDLTVEENLMMRDFRERPYAQRGVLALAEVRRHCQRLVAEYDVRTPGTAVRMRQLSGGNQQKVVLAREFDRRPTLLIASQPTRGLDVGATEFVYGRLLDHRAAGGATLLISSELEEILCLADRIAVMVQGRFLRVLDSADVTIERLGLLMGGQDDRG